MPKILFVGVQGSGKSTQGKLLAENLKVPYISTGDIFRKISQENSAEGQRIRQILESGNLVDDETTTELVKKRVTESDCQNGFILDGYPRNLNQVKLFDPTFDKVLYLKLSDEQASKRLMSRGRIDDLPENISQRLRVYHEQTDPMLNFYKEKGILQEIDGSLSVEEVKEKIRQVIDGQK